MGSGQQDHYIPVCVRVPGRGINSSERCAGEGTKDMGVISYF